MSDPFLGEVRIFGFNFAPMGWAFCNGQLLPLSQNTALFSLLGTMYGGNGSSNFALPNLQGRAPLQPGQGPGLSLYDPGQTGGQAAVTVLPSEIPAHTHVLSGSNSGGTQTSPVNATWASPRVGRQGQSLYSQTPGAGAAMSPQALAVTGNSAPHNNMPPYLSLNFCIALQGIYPSRP